MIACLVAAGAFAFAAAPAHAESHAPRTGGAQPTQIPACFNFPDSGGTLTQSPALPCDFTLSSGGDTLSANYRFAWNTFFAISWPAYEPDQYRGIPNVAAKFGAHGSTPVWDTWKEKRELYRVVRDESGIGGKWDSSDPGGFQTFPSQLDPNPSIGMCPGETMPSGKLIRRFQNGKIENFLDETDEIGLVVLWEKGEALPTEDSLVRYQVKLNSDYYNYVRAHSFYTTDPLNAFIEANTSDSAPVGPIQLPASSVHTQNSGAIMLKTGWRKLDTPAEAANYYTVEALYYDEVETVPPSRCYRKGLFGLIAIHVVRKTAKFPYFFFSTFEHDANYPGAFSYANTTGTGDTSVPSSLKPTSCPGVSVPGGTQVSSLLPNGCGIAYDDPSDPAAGVPNGGAYEAKRLIPTRSALDQVNQDAKAKNAGTVWANYRLVGVQTVPVGGQVNAVNPAADQDYYLANPVVETSQRFQYFTGDFVSSRVVNVYKGHDGGGRVMMGGCMGCHGAGAQGGARTAEEVKNGDGGTDFSFTLNNIRSKPGLYAADTLADVCEEIDLGYDSTTRACVRAAD